MEPNIKQRSALLWARIGRVACVLTIVLLSLSCSGPDQQTDAARLTKDEAYLVEAYIDVATAGRLHAVNYLKSDSLFTVLDSTIDTTRIANTIRGLNSNPDRWLLVFISIEQGLHPSQGEETGTSEETR